MDMQTLKLLIEALRTPSAGATVTPLTGPDAGRPRTAGPPTLSAGQMGSGMLGQTAGNIVNHAARGL